METVNIQCPSCKQSYSVAVADLQSNITEFNCSRCGVDFCCGPVNTDESFVSTFLKPTLEAPKPENVEHNPPDSSEVKSETTQDSNIGDKFESNSQVSLDDLQTSEFEFDFHTKTGSKPKHNLPDEPEDIDNVELTPQAKQEGMPQAEKPEIQLPEKPKEQPQVESESKPKETPLDKPKPNIGEKFAFNPGTSLGDTKGSSVSKGLNFNKPSESKSIESDLGHTCPRCDKKNISNAISCDFCGVVFEKYKKYMEQKNKANKDPIQDFVEKTVTQKPPATPKALDAETPDIEALDSETQKPEVTKTYVPVKGVEVGDELKAVWDNVKAHYDNEKEHKRFLQICLSQDKLTFASGQYRKILDANPNDEMASKMINNIVGLAFASYVPTSSEQAYTFRLGKSGAFAVLGFVLMMLSLLPEVDRGWLISGILVFTVGAGIRILKR